jgi:hypothetical protein
MRALLFLFVAVRLGAQEPAKPAPAASSVPSTESWLTGSIDLGYRWRSDVGGSYDAYRSIVNLGSGPKLLGAEFTITDPKHRAFDRVDARAHSWGDDPYATLHLRAIKKALYDFNADYRDISYFNFLPSYADPLLSRGLILNQQSFDVRRHFGSFQFDLLPGRWFTPYLAFDRDTGSGSGAATFAGDGNEYAVPNRTRDLTNLYRGGVHIDLARLHATLEQGGTTFKDDQSLYQGGGVNPGFAVAPVFGQRLSLNSLLAAYGIRGASIYSKALLSASATRWLDLYGQFLYSQPDSTVNYQQATAGTFFQQSQLLFYNSQQFLLSAQAKMPHTSGSAGAEIRPHSKVRILESWLTDRLHNTGAAASAQLLGSLGSSQAIATQLTSTLVTNYNQVETNVIWDAASRLTLRGGYRRVWGDADQAILPAAGLASADAGKLRRNVVLGGFTFRPMRKLSVVGEAEGASGEQAYFRTSLHDYQKGRAQVRYQLAAALSVSADVNILSNQNPAAGVRYDYQARQQSLSLLWSPAGGKRFDVMGSYSRSTVRSDIGFLSPQDLLPQQSLYRDRTHTATALFNVNLPHSGGLTPRLTAGGSFFISSGTRPTSYYQPVIKLWIPTGNKLNWFAEWRYYGYGEALYLYEGFRANLLTTGVRITR